MFAPIKNEEDLIGAHKDRTLLDFSPVSYSMKSVNFLCVTVHPLTLLFLNYKTGLIGTRSFGYREV